MRQPVMTVTWVACAAAALLSMSGCSPEQAATPEVSPAGTATLDQTDVGGVQLERPAPTPTMTADAHADADPAPAPDTADRVAAAPVAGTGGSSSVGSARGSTGQPRPAPAPPSPTPPAAAGPSAAEPAPSPTQTASVEALQEGPGWSTTTLVPDEDGESWSVIEAAPPISREGGSEERLLVRLDHREVDGDPAGRWVRCAAWIEASTARSLRVDGTVRVELRYGDEPLDVADHALDMLLSPRERTQDLPWPREHRVHATDQRAVTCAVSYHQ